MKRLSLFSILLTLIFCLNSCEEPVVNVSSITLNSTSLDMTEGDSFKLIATVSPDNATDKSVVWSSSNASIASVEDGVVTAVKEGNVTITVASKDGGARAACEVTVAAKVIEVESVTLSQKEATITVGKSLTLTATVLPENATDKTVTWTSNNTSVATVENGEVKAVSVGTASITATAGGKNATCTITVKEAYIEVTSVTLDRTSYSIMEGESFTLNATVKPDDATDKTVTWKSSNEKILKVYGGTVTAVSAGTATVTATAGKVSATCEVQVTAKIAVSEVVLDRNKLTLEIGQSEKLTATVLPENATDKTVIWSSSDDDVANVTDGTVTAVGAGKATITAKAGDKKAECVVTVKFIEVADIELSKTELTLNPGEYEILTTTIYPENATDKTVTWTSSDENIVTVTEYGKVTAVEPGNATITAQAGSATAKCEVKVINNNFLTITNNSKTYGDVTIKAGGVGAPTIFLKYSTDNGHTWTQLDGVKSSETITIPVNAGGSVRIYGENSAYARHVGSNTGYWAISANVEHSVSGDLMSLSGYSEDIASEYQFYRLFYGDTKLTDASQLRLNAAELTPHCYESMFQNCTSLKSAPAVKATTLASYCCRSMFEKCTSLQEAPTLSAATMTKADNCYLEMFQNCTALTKAPKLPATTLTSYCYKSMFQGCSALKEAPALPADKLANYCYDSMFQGCSKLEKAPALPAKTLATMCYEKMFQDCTSLKTAPALPATVVASGSYMSMFRGCSKLENAPELPAKTLMSHCYYGMFYDCQALTEAPALPATTLAANCYAYMFAGDIALTKTPVLPATKLKDGCYQRMFYNCRSIVEVTCLATDIAATDCTTEWLFYTADKGTFTKNSGIRTPDDEVDETTQAWTYGPSGIPYNWTVQDYVEPEE